MRALTLIAALVALVALGWQPAAAEAGTYRAAPAKKRVVAHYASPHRRAAPEPPVPADPDQLLLRSNAVLVLDSNGTPVIERNADHVQPIASITKLMTAMVVLDGKQDLAESITIDEADVDLIKNTRSRLRVGMVVRRGDLLRLALMASENRAAAALARAWPGGTPAFVEGMNAKAGALGLASTRFVDASGLDSGNVSSVGDLAKLVQAANAYPLIQEYSTTPGIMLTLPDSGRTVAFRNTNALVKNADWHIDVQKTGFINEAGHCLVMHATIASKPFVIVLLDAWGKYSRLGDANRIKRFLESKLVGRAGAGSA